MNKREDHSFPLSPQSLENTLVQFITLITVDEFLFFFSPFVVCFFIITNMRNTLSKNGHNVFFPVKKDAVCFGIDTADHVCSCKISFIVWSWRDSKSPVVCFFMSIMHYIQFFSSELRKFQINEKRLF